jgi:hypothetical protein
MAGSSHDVQLVYTANTPDQEMKNRFTKPQILFLFQLFEQSFEQRPA